MQSCRYTAKRSDRTPDPCCSSCRPKIGKLRVSIIVASFIIRTIFLFVLHGILIRYPITELRCNETAAFAVLALPAHHTVLIVQKLSDGSVSNPPNSESSDSLVSTIHRPEFTNSRISQHKKLYLALVIVASVHVILPDLKANQAE